MKLVSKQATQTTYTIALSETEVRIIKTSLWHYFSTRADEPGRTTPQEAANVYHNLVAETAK